MTWSNFARASLALGAVLTTAAAQSTTNISGASTTCNSFMDKLNSDASIKTCTAPLVSAVDYYTNATSSSASSSAANSALQDSLGRLCGANTGCDSNLIRQYLSEFWTSCMDEIKSQNTEVLARYDVLYLLNPFREAICSKDDSGEYCLTTVASSSSGAAATAGSRRDVEERGDGDDSSAFEQVDKAFEHPNAGLFARQSDVSGASDTVDNSSLPNIAFLFLQPTSSKDALCSTCAQNILASYIQFETSIPYAIGLSNSKVLSGQSALYKAAKTQCGDKWAVKVNSIAGTTDFAKVAGALGGARSSLAVVAAGAGVATLAMALLS
ncbi:unnamed protein product [Jaminaea pallidilutea]